LVCCRGLGVSTIADDRWPEATACKQHIRKGEYVVGGDMKLRCRWELAWCRPELACYKEAIA
jgi:hypothetical protein